MFWHWLATVTGGEWVGSVPSIFYNELSGFVSDIGLYTVFVGLAANATMLWRKHTCNRYWWCWRHPHYNLEGSPYMVCNKHHPDDHMSVEEAFKHHIHLRNRRVKSSEAAPVDLDVS